MAKMNPTDTTSDVATTSSSVVEQGNPNQGMPTTVTMHATCGAGTKSACGGTPTVTKENNPLIFKNNESMEEMQQQKQPQCEGGTSKKKMAAATATMTLVTSTGEVASTCPSLLPARPLSQAQLSETPEPSERVEELSPAEAQVPQTPEVQKQQREQQQQEEIDAALLSALRDPRERRTLFRLEQLLVDFMNEPKLQYLDVGPGYYSPANNTVSMSANQTSGSGGLLQNPPKIQNNFQRLILHRLADRFHIVRESMGLQQQQQQNPDNATIPYGGGASYPVQFGNMAGCNVPPAQLQGPMITPYTIRLVKTEQSHVPSELLIDLDLSSPQYSCNSDSGLEFNASGGAGTSSPFSTAALARTLSDSLSSSSFDGGAKPQPITVQKKMMIMKRSSSGGFSSSRRGDEAHGQKSSSKRNLRGKNLSDKEKAYAEARARIFAGENNNNDVVGENECCALSSSHNSSNSLADSASEEQQAHQQEQQPLTPEVVKSPSPPPSSPTSDDTPKGKSSAGGTVSKVTWRNRKQEENDPDFQRRRSVGAVGMGVMPLHASSHGVVMTQAGYASVGGAYGAPQDTSSSYGVLHGLYTQRALQQQPQQYYYPSAASPAVYSAIGSTNAYYVIENRQQQMYYASTQPRNQSSPAGTGAPIGGYREVGIFSDDSTANEIPSSASNLYNSEFPALR